MTAVALSADGRTLASVTARRTRQYPVEFGHSSSFVETVDEPAVAEAATRLLAAMRYTGVAEVEFKFDRRDGRYKLIEAPRLELYDHAADPAEIHNLAASQPAVVAQLRSILARHPEAVASGGISSTKGKAKKKGNP